METNKDYTVKFKVANSDYGDITIPKGTSLNCKAIITGNVKRRISAI